MRLQALTNKRELNASTSCETRKFPPFSIITNTKVKRKSNFSKKAMIKNTRKTGEQRPAGSV